VGGGRWDPETRLVIYNGYLDVCKEFAKFVCAQRGTAFGGGCPAG